MGNIEDGIHMANVSPNGGLDVNIQDQTTPPVIVLANKVDNITALTSAVAIGDRTITVDSATGFDAGDFIVIANVASNRYGVFKQVGAIAGSVVTLDTPLDFAFPAGTQVTNGTTNMAVDGSGTTQIFSLRASDPGLPLKVDITRIIFHCICTSGVDLNKFCNFTTLTNGLVFRRVDGTYQNIFNVKSNHELAGLMYDFTVHTATDPEEGQNGFLARMTFAGPSELGVALRVGEDEDLEFLVQDDLATAQAGETITSLEVTFEGHVVVDE